MIKILLLVFSLSIIAKVNAQKDFFVLMKHKKTVQVFATDSHIVFQDRNRSWLSGIITKIQNDSFYFKEEVVHYYAMGTDTVYYSGYRFAMNDVYAMPGPGATVNYNGDEIQPTSGTQHYVFVKNGSLFQLLGGGYLALNLINSVTQKDPPFASRNIAPLSVASAVLIAGFIMHKNYKPVWYLGHKYHLQYIAVVNNKK